MFVYSLKLTDEQINQVNRDGWCASEATKAYVRLSTVREQKETTWDHNVRNGIGHGLYVETWHIATDDLEEAFTISNGHGDISKVMSSGRHKSGSVGDVFVTSLGHGWLCADMGWIKLTDNTVRAFATLGF